jgi:hypothetical protein
VTDPFDGAWTRCARLVLKSSSEREMMHSKKMPLIVALTLSLAGCATLGPTIAPLEIRANPQVTVVGGKISLSSDVLYFGPTEKNVRITWKLPPSGAKSSIKITVDGALTDVSGKAVINDKPTTFVVLDPNQQEIVDCAPSADGLSFSCLNKNSKPGAYKYTIRVDSDGTVAQRDPLVVNGDH